MSTMSDPIKYTRQSRVTITMSGIEREVLVITLARILLTFDGLVPTERTELTRLREKLRTARLATFPVGRR